MGRGAKAFSYYLSPFMDKIYDYIIIGSGFGGSVSAMRLAEKGYSVLVIEKGKKYEAKDFPKTNWNVRKFLWMPKLRLFGFQNIDFFKEVMIFSGVGVGGGSLVYANTHMFPTDAFFNNPSWARFRDWKATLLPFYEKARFMLGSAKYEKMHAEDYALKELAEDMGKGDSFKPVDGVGVYFGDTKEFKDPYFNGLGPERKGCAECAGCMVGCRYHAKNTLDKNYLWFAQKFGAEVIAETEADKIDFKDGVYTIHTKSSTALLSGGKKVLKSKGLVVSGGVLGTLQLLFKQKYDHKGLEGISNTLGYSIRTNSESLCGVAAGKEKLNNGIAISRVFEPDEHTHIELVKYPNGSGLMGRLAVLSAGPGHPIVRVIKTIWNTIKHPIFFLKATFGGDYAKNSVILLVMQSLDNAMKLKWKRGLFGKKMAFDNKSGQTVPAYIDIGQQVMYKYADKVDGIAMNAMTEVFFNMSSTAHILGGCPMGETIEDGVINDKFQVHGYPNMYVLDGSIIQGNLGVNPSLTITALSEYAMSLIPEKEGNEQKSLEELMNEKETVKS